MNYLSLYTADVALFPDPIPSFHMMQAEKWEPNAENITESEIEVTSDSAMWLLDKPSCLCSIWLNKFSPMQ